MSYMLATEARRTWLRLAAAIPIAAFAPLAAQDRGIAANLVFSGSLERVRHESVSVKLADRRTIDARLPNRVQLAAQSLADRYQVGDRLEITCQPIKPVWEDEAFRYQSLELVKLRFLGPPSPQELSQMLASRPWRGGINLLRRPAAADTAPNSRPAGADLATDERLDHARRVNLAYAMNLPDFVADETARRYTSQGTSTKWLYRDTIESEIAFKGSRASRQRIRKDGRPWEQPFQALPGFKWYGGFGTEIEPVFNPECPTAIEYEGPVEVRGRQLLSYRFRSASDGCFGPFTSGYQRYNPARTGRVFLDDPGGNTMQLEEEAGGFPAGLDFAQRNEKVTWDYVKIGDASHLLPVAADFVVSFASGERWHVAVEYTNHRHFESATDITFR
jgi:hypothetical protein